MFHVLMRKMCIWQLLDEMFCRCLLSPFSLEWNWTVSSWIFCLDDLSIAESGVLMSPTNTVLQSFSSFGSINICFMYLGSLILGLYIIRIIIFSCWIGFLIVRQWPPLSLSTAFDLKVFKYYYFFLLDSICMEYLLLSLHFQSLCIHRGEMSFL
jgi:hypothetical protein